MKKTFLHIIILLLFAFQAVADEGMWLPQLLKTMNEEDMQVSGLKLTAEDLYTLNGSSLKDAIVSLGGFCTGEMISSEGLLLTNHHCALDAIQEHSSTKNNYLQDGFWAMNRGEELQNNGLTASFLISIEDVTKQILSDLNNNMSEKLRSKKIREISKKIIDEKIDSTHYTAQIKSFFGGNDFYLLTYETFKDVRLVGAPPSSIGKFGGDTDNWMWPRHTGDFALFRVYSSPNGFPAEYAKENIPYKPKHHLPIQLNGVENGDYTMIFGYPGSTKRYLTSYGIKQALTITNPAIINIRNKKLAIMKEGMDISKKTKIQYSSKYANTSNYWKYFIGQSKGLKSMKVEARKATLENKFRSWISNDTILAKKYDDALKLIEGGYQKNKNIELNRTYLNEAIFRGAEIMYWAFSVHRQVSKLPKEVSEKKSAISEIKKSADEFYKNYNVEIDQKLFASMLEMYYYNVPREQHAKIFKTIENQLFGFKKLDFGWYAKNTYKKSFFASQEAFLKFLEHPSKIKIEQDPAYKTIMSIYNEYIQNIAPIRSEVREELAKGSRLFIAGLREMSPNKKYYPDANSTMRVTYGNVSDYTPGEAMHFKHYTTIDGIIEKEDAKDEEFRVPKKLKELHAAKNYGRYSDKNGDLRVNFISNNDITGGNSGSPVINAWGEIVGTAFDGNWEAMSGDIAFEKEVQRTISVDIRYVLFIIDKFAGATHLINEMTIAPQRERK
ncbi:MAG: serine protease [Flavobacteriales bacterium]|nr:serine protease [Flavobacteriales bacterium]